MGGELGDIEDRRKTPHSETLNNTIAITKLTEITSNLTKDTDRLVMHIEKILPFHEILANLKNLLWAVVVTSVGFGIWITQEHFELKDKVNTLMAVGEQKHQEVDKITNNNKNQIQYLKGRLK